VRKILEQTLKGKDRNTFRVTSTTSLQVNASSDFRTTHLGPILIWGTSLRFATTCHTMNNIHSENLYSAPSETTQKQSR